MKQKKKSYKKKQHDSKKEALDKKKQLILEAEKEIMDKFIRNKYWDLYVDVFLIFSLTIAYTIILYFTEIMVANIFIVFGMICCSIISYNYYNDVKSEIEMVLKDLEFLLK